jgi:rusticyanin
MSHNLAIRIALITALVIVSAFGGYAVSRLTAYPYGHYAGRYANPGNQYGSFPGNHSSPAASPGNMGSMGNSGNANGRGAAVGFSSRSLAARIARQVGTRLAGKAPQTVSTSQARTLSEQAPAAARIDRSARTITFTGTSVSFTVVAIPPFGPDMTFGIAGLSNPKVIVRKGARVTVRFINADPNEAHAWMVTSRQPPFTFGQSVIPAITGAFAGVIGDPTAAGDGASTITFQASTVGSYYYICPMPGHAQMGMYGGLVVR